MTHDAHVESLRQQLGVAAGKYPEVAADPSAESLGALTGVRFELPRAPVVLNAYVFESYELAIQTANRLFAAAAPGTVTVTTVNGSLLLFGVAPADNRKAVKKLKRLASRFAGEE